ncbi:MAG: hypothetical protein M3N98_12615 [Actinomycetota bacterium]|nr:hypothetical protein [Actinomycetota bacterium]
MIVDRTKIINVQIGVHVFNAGFVLLNQVVDPDRRAVLFLDNGTAEVLGSVFGPVIVGTSGTGHYSFVGDDLAAGLRPQGDPIANTFYSGFNALGGNIDLIGDIVGGVDRAEPNPSNGQHLRIWNSVVWVGSSDSSSPFYVAHSPQQSRPQTYTVGDHASGKTPFGPTIDFTSRVADPRFVSASDLHLQPGSPAIGSGPYGTAGQDPPPNHPALNATTTSISPPASAAAGQPVTMSAQVSFPGSDPPTGTVAFHTSPNGIPVHPASDPVLGTAAIDTSGQATLTTAPPAGHYHIYAWPSSNDDPAMSGLLQPPVVPDGLANYEVNPGPADHLVLTPGTATVAAGGSQAYTAEAFDRFGNDAGPVTGSTTLSIAPDGTCNATTCSATTPGRHTVTGSEGPATGTAVITVTGGPLDHLVLAPATATVIDGAAQAYTAEGFDAFGNDLGAVTANTVFSVAPDGACNANRCSPTQPGPYTVTGTDVTKTGTAGLTALTVPTITWPDPAGIVYGTLLSSTQLDATASVPGTFAYTPTAGAVVSAGANEPLSVTFTPTDTANYSTTSALVLVNVNRATPTVTWAPPADIVYGRVLGTGELNATASVPGAFVYTPAVGRVLPAGATQPLSVAFTPTDMANYASAGATVHLNVTAAPLTVTANRATRMYGQPNPALVASYDGFVNGDSATSLAGTLIFTTPATAASSVGNYPITPSGHSSNNYSIAYHDGSLAVTPAPLAVTADNKSRLYGQANPPLTYTITGFVNHDPATVVSGSPALATAATASSFADRGVADLIVASATSGVHNCP